MQEGVMVSAIKASQQAKAEEFSGLDEIFESLQQFLCSAAIQGARPRWEFIGTVGQLMAEVGLKDMSFATQRHLSTPKAFSDYLKRQKKEWAAMGLLVEFGTKGREGRRVKVSLKDEIRGDPDVLAVVEAVKGLPKP